MTWLLTDGSTILASGSWQAVIAAGEELGLIGRRYRDLDGFELSPVMLVRGLVMAPEGMFPEICEDARYG